MLKTAKKWWRKQSDITKKVGGLAEKAAATQRKLEVSLSILGDQRKEDIPVEIDRRKNGHLEENLGAA